MNYATPSSRFAKPDPIARPAMFAAPAADPMPYPDVAGNADSISTSQSGNQIAYAKPAVSDTRPESTAKTQAQLDAEASSKSNVSALDAAGAGFQNSAVPATTDTTANVISVLGNTASGIVDGASAGAVVGGVGAIPGAIFGGSIALVTSGLNAWVGNRQASAERDRQNALNADAKRVAAEQQAINQKWMVQNRLDSLEEAQYQRKTAAQKTARDQMDKVSQTLKARVTDNAALKNQWANYGFT